MTIIGVKIDQKFMRDLLILIIGVGLYVLSVQLFVIPNRLSSNGVAGFSVLMDFVFGINPALTFFLVNVPLFIFGGRLLPRRILLLSIPGALAMSLWLMIYEALGVTGFQFSHVIFAGIFDGILSGIGAGLVIISEGTFGGSILLSRILEEQWDFKIDKVLFLVDVVVLSVSLLTFLSLPNFAVTLLSCYIFSKMTLIVGREDYRKSLMSRGKKIYQKVFAA
ncbi:YitT family protein [Lactococcus cremoris]|uniref:YitT family protein n=1 Tax=Lactococcus lactis subsp. cremoris TaxID=1359 RepID=UPI0021821E76|nr:YitT family protein [Lactococcus cremoris]MCT0503343.1 YitT family protein [Lactococcus cremoris]MCT0505980.1 YitT family protein [Lactococcus cremoris]